MTFHSDWGSNPEVDKIFANKEDAIQYLVEQYKKGSELGKYSEPQLRKLAAKCLTEKEVEGA